LKLHIQNDTPWRTADVRAIVSGACRAVAARHRKRVRVVNARTMRLSGYATLGSRRFEAAHVTLRVPSPTVIRKALASEVGTWVDSLIRALYEPSDPALAKDWAGPQYVAPAWGYTGSGNERVLPYLYRRIEVAADSALRLPARLAALAVHELLHSQGAQHADMTKAQRACEIAVPWAAELPLRAQSRRAGPDRHALVERRAAHARAMHARALRRLRLARTLEAKWRARVRYYARREKAS